MSVARTGTYHQHYILGHSHYSVLCTIYVRELVHGKTLYDVKCVMGRSSKDKIGRKDSYIQRILVFCFHTGICVHLVYLCAVGLTYSYVRVSTLQRSRCLSTKHVPRVMHGIIRSELFSLKNIERELMNEIHCCTYIPGTRYVYTSAYIRMSTRLVVDPFPGVRIFGE